MPGVLHGYLRFRGEGRYTEIRAERMRATRRRIVGRCQFPRDRLRMTFLTACTEDDAVLAADAYGGERFFVAFGPFERRDGLFISGIATASGGRDLMRFKRDLSSAELTPGLPFRGRGKFADEALTGSLRFRTPGSRRIPMVPADAVLSEDPDSGSDCGLIRFLPIGGASTSGGDGPVLHPWGATGPSFGLRARSR